uniref:SSD domain-containing protein n=1 Tax=Caenorhabditis tropicalis TaxID=1561998 RepID=A0A1I7SXL5_9PELO
NGYQILSDGDQNSRIKIQYPVSDMFGRQFSLQPNFFGVELFDQPDEAAKLLDSADGVFEANATRLVDPVSRITNVKSVKMITLQFRAEHKPGWTEAQVKKWEMSMVDIFEKRYNSKRLKIYAYSQSYVEEEMVRGGIIMIPYLVVGFAIMCICSCVLVMIRALYMHQENGYKVILAIMACLTPLLACATALALMFLCGIRFASILCVIPFLVLSIGKFGWVRLPLRRAKVCQGVPKRAKACQGVPRRAKACQGVPRRAKACQGVLRRAKACQGVPRCPKACQGVPRCP